MPTRIREITIEEDDDGEDGEDQVDTQESMQEEDDGPVVGSRKRPASARLQIEDADNFPHHDSLDDVESDDDEESEQHNYERANRHDQVLTYMMELR